MPATPAPRTATVVLRHCVSLALAARTAAEAIWELDKAHDRDDKTEAESRIVRGVLRNRREAYHGYAVEIRGLI